MTIYATPPDRASTDEIVDIDLRGPRTAGPERAGPELAVPECTVHPGGWTLLRHRYHRPEQRERLIDRYLHPVELEVHDLLDDEDQMPWLLGRVAAKDAVVERLADSGFGVVPHHFAVLDSDDGRPHVLGLQELAPELSVGIAHLDGCAVAITAEGADVGISIDAIDDRPSSFSRMAFSRAERAGRHLAGVDDRTWMTAAWCAKRAVGRAIGTMLDTTLDTTLDVDALDLDVLDGGRRADEATVTSVTSVTSTTLETRVVGPGLLAVGDRVVRWVQLDSATATSAAGRSLIVGWTVVPDLIIDLDRRR